MPTPLVVPDASVLLKWVLPSDDEPDGDRALLLRTAILDETYARWHQRCGFMRLVTRSLGASPVQASGWLSALLKFGIERPRQLPGLRNPCS